MVSTPANSINESGASGLCNFDGTATFSTTALTQYNVLSGASANTVNSISPSTAGYILTSNGPSAQPTFQVPVITGVLTYYFTNTASSVAGELQQTQTTFTPKTTQTFTGIASGVTLLETFITNAGVPGLSFLPAGQYVMHVHADQTAGTRNVQLYAEIWEASSVGVDIAMIGTTGSTTVLTGSEIEYVVSFSTANTYAFGSSASRIKTKVYASGAVIGSNATVDIYVGGTADSHTTLPGPSVDVTNFVPYTGATADVNLGTHGITANSATLTTALTVPNGGTGDQSFTAYAVICGGTTSTAALQNVASVGTTGQLLGSNGAGALPSFTSSAAADFTFTSATAGTTRTLTVSNTDNTNASSIAIVNTTVGGGSAGDPKFQAVITGAQTWSFGADNSDSDAFVISSNASLGTTNIMRVATTGEINFPLTTAFLAYQASTQTNVTGAGGFYYLGATTALTEIFDQNSDFNTNGTFTAPVTGRYQLSSNVTITGCTSATTIQMKIVTSNRNYTQSFVRGGSTADLYDHISYLCDMDAADTATIAVASSGEASATDDVYGTSEIFTGFSGFLAC